MNKKQDNWDKIRKGFRKRHSGEDSMLIGEVEVEIERIFELLDKAREEERKKILKEYKQIEKDGIEVLCQEEVRQYKQTLLEKINDLMKEFANTPLDKRGTGWNWLIKVRKIIKETK